MDLRTAPSLRTLPSREYRSHGARGGTLTLVVVATLLCVVGCQRDTGQRDAYIRELRMQEDQIYELQDYMTEYQHLLRQQRKENQLLREQLGKPSGDDATSPTEGARDDESSDRSLLDRPRRDTTDEPEDVDTPDLPDIDLGEPALPEIDLGEPTPADELEEIPAGELDELSHRTAAGDMQLASASMPASDVFTPPPRPIERARSCAIYAEQMPLEPGDGDAETSIGLMAIVEPLTADGAAGYFTGELSLMLVDPLASDEQWEISRWDYTPEEVEAAWRDHSRRVLDLPLAAPNAAPRGRPLELWVRLIPSEQGGKILCSTAVTLSDSVGLLGVPVSGGESSTDPNALVTSGWTAADRPFADAGATPKPQPATWKTATMAPPAAVARAEAAAVEPRTTPSKKKVAERTPGWSPFR